MKYFSVKSEIFGTVKFERIEVQGENGSVTTIYENPVKIREFQDPEKFALSYDEMMQKIKDAYCEYSEHKCGWHAYYQACGCHTVSTVWHGNSKFEDMRHFWPCHHCESGIVGGSSNGSRNFYCSSHSWEWEEEECEREGCGCYDSISERYYHLADKFDLAYRATAR